MFTLKTYMKTWKGPLSGFLRLERDLKDLLGSA